MSAELYTSALALHIALLHANVSYTNIICIPRSIAGTVVNDYT